MKTTIAQQKIIDMINQGYKINITNPIFGKVAYAIDKENKKTVLHLKTINTMIKKGILISIGEPSYRGKNYILSVTAPVTKVKLKKEEENEMQDTGLPNL